MLKHKGVVDEFDYLAAADRATMRDVAADVAQERFDPCDQRLARTDHDAERAGHRGFASARNWCVRELHSRRRKPHPDRACLDNAGRAEIHHDQSALAASRDTVPTEA